MRLIPRALAALAFALLCLPAYAVDVPMPKPFAEAFPDRAGECVTLSTMKGYLQGAIEDYGGAGLLVEGERAQAFADAWRGLAGLPKVKVEAGIGWVDPGGSLSYSEIVNGCVINFTVFTTAQLEAVVGAMPKQQRDPTVAPEGMPLLLPNGLRNV